MAYYSGNAGSVKWATNAVNEIKEWNCTSTLDVLDVSIMGGGAWKQQAAAMLSWQGQFMVNFDYGDTTGQKAITDKITGASPTTAAAALELHLSTTKYLGGNALVSSIVWNAPAAGIVSATISFVGTGALTPTWS